MTHIVIMGVGFCCASRDNVTCRRAHRPAHVRSRRRARLQRFSPIGYGLGMAWFNLELPQSPVAYRWTAIETSSQTSLDLLPCGLVLPVVLSRQRSSASCCPARGSVSHLADRGSQTESAQRLNMVLAATASQIVRRWNFLRCFSHNLHVPALTLCARRRSCHSLI